MVQQADLTALQRWLHKRARLSQDGRVFREISQEYLLLRRPATGGYGGAGRKKRAGVLPRAWSLYLRPFRFRPTAAEYQNRKPWLCLPAVYQVYPPFTRLPAFVWSADGRFLLAAVGQVVQG